jgi:hypothetical protein
MNPVLRSGAAVLLVFTCTAYAANVAILPHYPPTTRTDIQAVDRAMYSPCPNGLPDRVPVGFEIPDLLNQGIKLLEAKQSSDSGCWFRAAALRGSLDGQMILGSLLYTVSPVVGYAYFLGAAEHGSKDGQLQVAAMLMRGDGTPRNPAEAVRWYRMSKGQNARDAQPQQTATQSAGPSWGKMLLAAGVATAIIWFLRPSDPTASRREDARQARIAREDKAEADFQYTVRERQAQDVENQLESLAEANGQ